MQGGVIRNYGNLKVTADFIGNSATAEVQDGSINAKAYGYGGAIYNHGNASTISGDYIDNSATTSGGAIYNLSEIGSINGSFITNHALNGSGGAIYNGQSGNIQAVAGAFISNTAAQSGGAIYNKGSNTTSAIINMNAGKNKSIKFNDKITGSENIDKNLLNI